MKSKATLALGAMNFGKRTPAGESERIVRRALERGITVFDTANVYNDGESERILGRALGKDRERVKVASKVGLWRREGLSRAAVLAAIDGTLERLGTDAVDFYYLHAPDHATPIEETLDALAELFEKKKIRAWGVSNYASWQILEMNALADARAMPRAAISQVIYNLLIRELEIEYFAFARRLEELGRAIHSSIYNPLAGGLLTGRYARRAEDSIEKGARFDKNAMYLRRYWTDRMFERARAYIELAAEAGMSSVDLAYAWVASHPGVDSILVGPTNVAQLDAAFDALEKMVSPEIAARIDAIHLASHGTDTHYVR